MYRKKRKHRRGDDLEKERLIRSKSQDPEKGSQQLDVLTIQQARSDPSALKQDDVPQLQRTIGNRLINRLLTGKPIQRKVNKWKPITVGGGVIVFHATLPQHAQNIIQQGVRTVQNQFGGGRLGTGFYTHYNKDSALLYMPEPESYVVLEFRLNRNAIGQIVPQNIWLGNDKYFQDLDVTKGNDFLTAEEDNQELKFHHGECLELVFVHQGKERFTPGEWLSKIGEAQGKKAEEQAQK